jgi:lipid II:glycine glycyltransferase (peptidoglycan interpeptide bridge formation enzyme)
MIIKEITAEEFDNFAENHMLGSFYQTSSYGKLMNKYGYKEMYIGGFNDEKIVAGSLILTKSISLNVKYGYAPRGFLINYFEEKTFKEFTTAVKKYFSKKGFAFIKINPIITYSEAFPTTNTKNINEITQKLIETLEKNNYKKLKDNVYFESILPKYNPIINLKNYEFNKLDKKTQNRINKINNKGLSLIKGDIYNVNTLFELVKRKEDKTSDFYKNIYKIFNEKNMIDLFLVEVNYHTYLENLQEEHNTEETVNEKINKVFQLNPSNKAIYVEKMNSDKKLHDINNEISDLNIKIQNEIYKETIAAALVIKKNNIASIYISGFKKEYNKLNPNYYLHYMLLEYYKKQEYMFFDLNGITGDFTKTNPYRGLNEFKLSWNPRIFEYIGEFDLIINQTKYSLLWSTKALHKEFEKQGLKVPQD